MKTRQKNKNANFKILYDRIKNELKEREIFRKYKKYRLPVFNITKFTSIDEVNVPSFFNDKNKIIEKNQKNSISTNFSSPSISVKSFEEDNLKEEIEKLKQEINLLYEMLNNINNSSFEVKEEEKFDFTNSLSKFCLNKVSDFNLDNDRNLSFQSENISICNDKIEKEKFFEEKLYFQKYN